MTVLTGPARPAPGLGTTRHWRWTQPAIVLLVGAVVLLVVRPGPFDLRVLTLVAAYAIAAVGFNVLVGFAGVVSIGNSLFLAAGGYAWAILAVPRGPLVALLAGVVVAAVIAAAAGLALLRLRAYYFAVGTLALGTLGTVVMRNWTPVTNGDAGITGAGYLKLFGLTGVSSIFAAAVLLLAVFLYLQEALRTSPLGLAMIVGRFDPPVADALGVNVSRTRVAAFVLSAVSAAVGGALVAQLAGGAFPDQFSTTAAISLLVIPIIGGRGWRWAPVVGAIVVIAAPEYLRFLDEYRLAVYGVIVTFVALFLPGGIHQLVRGLAARTGLRRHG